MTNDEVKAIVGDTPHMTRMQADQITQFITGNRIRSILELGFKHGVSTSFMAAALARSGGGSIVTIDLESARALRPNVEQFLDRIGERDRVQVFYEPTSYTWRLMKFLDEDPTPRYNLCYLDGAHDWFVDALAFFLVDRLLKPGGWIIFDDIDWTYASSPTLRDSEHVRQMPEEERTTAQVGKIYDLLVKTHPDYGDFRREGDWAFARKKPTRTGAPAAHREVIVEQVVRVERVQVGIGAALVKGMKALRRR